VWRNSETLTRVVEVDYPERSVESSEADRTPCAIPQSAGAAPLSWFTVPFSVAGHTMIARPSTTPYAPAAALWRSNRLITAVVVLGFLVSSEVASAPRPKRAALGGSPGNPTQAAAQSIATKQARTNFERSLEAKGNTDFLLTPALLVREAISSGAFVTYPSE